MANTTREVRAMSKKAIKNLFIDANIWLSLFHYTNDDLEQFGKLRALIGTDIRLFVPDRFITRFIGIGRTRSRMLKQ